MSTPALVVGVQPRVGVLGLPNVGGADGGKAEISTDLRPPMDRLGVQSVDMLPPENRTQQSIHRRSVGRSDG